MVDLKVELDPAEAGFSPDRLGRVDRHFARYVEAGLLPGFVLLISRNGHVVHLAIHGERDIASGSALQSDTIFRIYSMTKPVTSVAAMMLYEEGAFQLKDPVSHFIPSFADVRGHVRVLVGGQEKSSRW